MIDKELKTLHRPQPLCRPGVLITLASLLAIVTVLVLQYNKSTKELQRVASLLEYDDTAPIVALNKYTKTNEDGTMATRRFNSSLMMEGLRLLTDSDEGRGLRSQLTNKHISCSKCTSISTNIFDAARDLKNVSGASIEMKKALMDMCNTVYTDSLFDYALCTLFTKVSTLVMPEILQEAVSCGWDIPRNFCALVIGMCDMPCCSAAHPYRPEQVMLTLSDSTDLTRLKVSWVTLENASAPHVILAKVSDDLLPPRAIPATTSTFHYGGWKGIIYTATLTGLERGQTYRYTVGDSVPSTGGSTSSLASDSALRSSIFTFHTLPDNIGTKERPLRYLYLADMGWMPISDNTARRVTEHIEAGSVDVILMNGDLSYFDGQFNHLDTFLRKFNNTLALVPVVSTPGNHEFWYNFTSYRRRFNDHMPQASPEWPPGGLYYPLQIGPVQFLNLDSELPDFPWAYVPTEEVHFANSTLASFNKQRSSAPWIIVSLHHPLYCTGESSCVGVAAYMKQRLENVFLEHKVDLVQEAHVHNYQRSYPIKHNQRTSTSYVNAPSPVYIMNGAAGNHELNFSPGNEEWDLYPARSKDYGYSIITVYYDESTKEGELRQQFYRSKTNEVVDDFTIAKRQISKKPDDDE